MDDFRVRTMKQKRPTCPTTMELDNLPNSQCVTPKKKEELSDEEEQLMSDDSDSERSVDRDSQGSSDSDANDQQKDEDILEKDEQMKQKEIEDIKAFALANGFDV